MRLLLEEDLARCRNLPELQEQTLETFRALCDDGFELYYVAGPISCDGEEKIPENLDLLVQSRTEVMHGLGEGKLVFTAPFVFTPEVYANLGIFALGRAEREARLQEFWDGIILSGLISGIYFRKGSERSAGSRRERRTAHQKGVPVFDL